MDFESELGLSVITGNTQSSNFTLRQKIDERWRANLFQFRFRLVESSAKGAETALNWQTSLRYDRELDPRLTAFAVQGVESDRFAGVRRRDNTDLGARRHFIKREKEWIWAGEAGYRYVVEKSVAGQADWWQLARVFSEVSHTWKVRDITLSGNIEYLLNFSDHDDYFVNSEFSLTTGISEQLSLKTTYSIRYSNTPAAPAVVPTDTALTTSLVAKF